MTVNRFGVPLVVGLGTLVAWGCTSSVADSSGTPSTADGTVWRESETGLSIGIVLSEEAKNAASPVLDIYLKNRGSNDVADVIPVSAVLTVRLPGVQRVRKMVGAGRVKVDRLKNALRVRLNGVRERMILVVE